MGWQLFANHLEGIILTLGLLSVVVFWLYVIICRKKVTRLRAKFGNYEELKKKYGKLESCLGYILIFGSFLLAFIYTMFFSWLASSQHSSKDHVYLILPSLAIWALHGLFLGIITSAILLYFPFKWLLGPKMFDEYNLYQKLKNGSSGLAIFIFLTVMIIGVNMITLPLCFNYYAEVDDHQIIINKFGEFKETTYSFNNVKSLNQVESQRDQKRRITRRRYHGIVFDDGYILSFDHGNLNLNWDKQVEVVKFIAGRSSLKISVVDPYPEQK